MNTMFQKVFLSILIALSAGLSASLEAGETQRVEKTIHFANGASSATVNGEIKGYASIDYRLNLAAGQQLRVGMVGSNGANQFNILPPGSNDVAMFSDGYAENPFSGLLPVDGTYTIRVYLMRSAARRNESSRFSLSVEVTGKPLRALDDRVDARLQGTPYHAKAPIDCQPAYSDVRRCDAFVIRRGHDGTATVEVRWGKVLKRNILFVGGKPKSSDSPRSFNYIRNEKDFYVITFDGGERFKIPDALISGG